MKIKDIMSRNVVTSAVSASLAGPAQVMWEKDVGFVPIVDPQSDRLVGVITDRDLAITAYLKGRPLHEIPVVEVMQKTVLTCREDEDAGRAQALMRRAQIHRLPVVDAQGRLAGVISMNDLARCATHHELPRDTVLKTITAICRPRQARHDVEVREPESVSVAT